MMEVQIVKEGMGHLLIFTDGSVSNVVFLEKKEIYQLMQLLAEEALNDLKEEE
jgi:hypothetical protein